ncbi:MAG: hypothetical protein NTY63_02570 [Candidatus Bipolaricaulota bacterium]|nr:hypothetical protein [Candidatus Bipolaricaulota bacterium]
MSLVIAVRENQDIVMACDGRVLAEDLSVMVDNAPKTLALNAELCIGLAGPTDALRHVLTSLGIRCRGTHPADLLQSCQARCPIDINYEDARAEVTRVLQWMLRRVAPTDRVGRIPSVLLGGHRVDSPALAAWQLPLWITEENASTGPHVASVGQVPPRGSRELAAFREAMTGEKPAEDRLARAVRICARYFGPEGPIGEVVYVRRLSHGFRLVRAA